MLESDTAGFFDPLGEPPGGAVAFNPQRARDDERILEARLLDRLPVPESARAVFGKGPPVEAGKILGLRVPGRHVPRLPHYWFWKPGMLGRNRFRRRRVRAGFGGGHGFRLGLRAIDWLGNHNAHNKVPEIAGRRVTVAMRAEVSNKRQEEETP